MYKLFLFSSLLIMACATSVDRVAEIEKIRTMLKDERKAHFDKNVEAFLSNFADSTIQLNHGDIIIASKAEAKKRFTPYFESVTFQKWDDVREPIIELSEDGSMAYAALEKTVVLTYPDTLGKPLYDSANYAWVSIYRKIDNQWKLVCNASTQEECYN